MADDIQQFLITRYPGLADIFRAVGVIPRLRPRDMPLPEGVVRVVVGQMLSSEAAQTIYSRMKAAAANHSVKGTWELHHATLRSCGLSRAKVRTIREFGLALQKTPTMLNNWPHLEPELLIKEIKSFWGMSDWTAAILALAYVGHQDIFPEADGSLARARKLLESRIPKCKFDPSRAAPYRSYLALYLWRALDEGILR